LGNPGKKILSWVDPPKKTKKVGIQRLGEKKKVSAKKTTWEEWGGKGERVFCVLFFFFFFGKKKTPANATPQITPRERKKPPPQKKRKNPPLGGECVGWDEKKTHDGGGGGWGQINRLPHHYGVW